MPANKKWIFFWINVMSPFEILLFCFLEYYGFNLKVESIFMKLSCNRCVKKNSPRIIIIDEIVKVHLIAGKLILRVRKRTPNVTPFSVFRKAKLAKWKASCFSLSPAGGEAVLRGVSSRRSSVQMRQCAKLSWAPNDAQQFHKPFIKPSHCQKLNYTNLYLNKIHYSRNKYSKLPVFSSCLALEVICVCCRVDWQCCLVIGYCASIRLQHQWLRVCSLLWCEEFIPGRLAKAVS